MMFGCYSVRVAHNEGRLNITVTLSVSAVPLLCCEVQQPPSRPPHFSLSSETSLSRASIRSRTAAKSAWQHEPDAGLGTKRILCVRTRGEPGVRSTSWPSTWLGSETHRSDITILTCDSEGTDALWESRVGLGMRKKMRCKRKGIAA